MDYVSGYVNSKNTFGGYVGDRFFVAYFIKTGMGAVEIEENSDDDTSVAAWVKSLQSRAEISQALDAPYERLHNCSEMDDFARENAGSSVLEYSRMRLQNSIDAVRSQPGGS
ncbi:MAG: hypothetical protein LC648_04150 [Novosphingobium sp.]|nr:hypothetical protein [Novosphingobium sp.]